MTCFETVSSLQPGCLFSTKIVYCVPNGVPGKSKTTPAIIWSRVWFDLIGVVVVEPVYILKGPIAFELNVNLIITWAIYFVRFYYKYIDFVKMN